MQHEPFLEGVKSILQTQFSAFHPAILEEKKFPGMGAYLTAEVPGLLLLFTLEYGIDFVLEVASPEVPKERHHVLEVLLLISGEPYRPGAARVGKSFDELRRQCERLAADFEQVRALFAPENLVETKERLRGIRMQVMQPLLELAEQNRAAKKE